MECNALWIKKCSNEFQNIMNDIFNPFSHFSIVYIDDILIFTKSISEHWKHLTAFFYTIKSHGLDVSAPKIKFYQTKVCLIGYDIHQNTLLPISRSIEFASKFPDEILDNTQ